ncbi:MAG: hypothetical protein ABIK64_06745, partial [Bacillota bacterium]
KNNMPVSYIFPLGICIFTTPLKWALSFSLHGYSKKQRTSRAFKAGQAVLKAAMHRISMGR